MIEKSNKVFCIEERKILPISKYREGISLLYDVKSRENAIVISYFLIQALIEDGLELGRKKFFYSEPNFSIELEIDPREDCYQKISSFLSSFLKQRKVFNTRGELLKRVFSNIEEDLSIDRSSYDLNFSNLLLLSSCLREKKIIFSFKLFDSEEERKEAEQKDLITYEHKRVGLELSYFFFDPINAPYEPFYFYSFIKIVEKLKRRLLLQKLEKGYNVISTPLFYKSDLWEASGHLSNYLQNMFILERKEEQSILLKPMGCPSASIFLKNFFRTTETVKIFEFGKVFRKELSGVKDGLKRVSTFTQDDSHIFCSSSEEVRKNLKELFVTIVMNYRNTFECLDLSISISTRPEKFIGKEEIWKEYESILRETITSFNCSYDIKEGDGAFYGPKIDFAITDLEGKRWQLATIQLDFNLTQRLGIKDHSIVLHSACLGSIERFLAVLLEKNRGYLPLVLSDRQLCLLVIDGVEKAKIAGLQMELNRMSSDNFLSLDYVLKVLPNRGLSSHLSSEISRLKREKFHYYAVVGEKESRENLVKLIDLRNGVSELIQLDSIPSYFNRLLK